MTTEIPDEDNKVLRICPLVSDVPDPLPASEKRTCADCGREVWFHTAQEFPPDQEFAKNPDLILCGACGLIAVLHEGGMVMNVGPAPFKVPSMDEELKELFNEHGHA